MTLEKEREVNSSMKTSSTANGPTLARQDERGAALVTVLIISFLLLAAGGALIMTTVMSATNAIDTTSETQAYYAAESGLQATLNVLRGNVAPNPLFDANQTAPENKISFRRAVAQSTSNLSTDTNVPRLSRWLSYDSTYTDRVTIGPNYSPVNGMAFNTTVSDPDNSATVTFSTSGVFTNYGTTTHQFGSGNNKFTLGYQSQSTTTITNSGASTLGYFTIGSLGTGCASGGCTLTNEPFNLTITQTAPWPMTLTINCTLAGTFASSSSYVVVTFPTPTNNLQGTLYARASNPVNSNSTTSILVLITAPEPNRLVTKVTGFGPRGGKKQMQMIVSRFAFDFTAVSAITLRSADDNTVLTFNSGSSAVYSYSGFDNAGGQNFSAFGVTSAPDYAYLTGLSLPSGQVIGSPSAVQQVSISSLPSWLQTADGARQFVDQMRNSAGNENRYFTTAAPPPDFGTPSHPVITFVDGDAVLSPAGGAGLLVVTGTLTINGNSPFDGLILVLGTGQLIRAGGGNGNSLGAVFVASFASIGNFLAPTFNSSGSGTSSIQYDSDWIRRALASTGPRVMAVSEY
jgi:hypothetical protein